MSVHNKGGDAMHPSIVIFEIIFSLPVTSEELRAIVSRATHSRRCEEEDFYRNNEHAFRFVVGSSSIAGNFLIENSCDSEGLFHENGVCRGIRIKSFLPKGRNGRCVGPMTREEWNKNALKLGLGIREAFNAVKHWEVLK